MSTLIHKQFISKSSIILYTIASLVLSVLLSSCSGSDGIVDLETDGSVLIDQIESAERVFVSSASIPAASQATFRGDLADSYIVEVEFAKNLGYKVVLITDNESRVEARSTVYFSTKGRKLVDRKDKRNSKRNKCFQFVFPIDFITPDATSITLNSKEDWILIKDWYAENQQVKQRPEMLFPLDISMEDGTIQTLIDRDDLKTIKDSCKKGKDKRKCFKLVLPIRFTMPDATVIEVGKRADYKLLKKWRKANPRVKEKKILNFPIRIEFKDGTSAEINDQKALEVAKKAC